MKFLKNLWNGVKSFWSKRDEVLDKIVPIAVWTTQALKKAVDSGAVEFLFPIAKKLIPTKIDDVLLSQIVTISNETLPEICLKLQIIQASNHAAGSHEQFLEAIEQLEFIRKENREKWIEFCKAHAGTLIEKYSDGKYNWRESGELAGKWYDENLKKIIK